MTEPERWLTPLPWLCQGDIFLEAPVLDVSQAGDQLTVMMTRGPALLVTHDCSLDKMQRGVATIERMSFVRLRSVQALQNVQRQQALRRDELQPYEAAYLGDVPEVGESYVLTSEPYPVPASYFQARMQRFDNPPEGEDPGYYLVAPVHDSRCARLTAGTLTLLRDKWNAQWTRRLPDYSGSS